MSFGEKNRFDFYDFLGTSVLSATSKTYVREWGTKRNVYSTYFSSLKIHRKSIEIRQLMFCIGRCLYVAKFFNCTCSQCNGPDWMRLILCPDKCGDNIVIMDPEKNDVWFLFGSAVTFFCPDLDMCGLQKRIHGRWKSVETRFGARRGLRRRVLFRRSLFEESRYSKMYATICEDYVRTPKN